MNGGWLCAAAQEDMCARGAWWAFLGGPLNFTLRTSPFSQPCLDLWVFRLWHSELEGQTA